MYSLKFFKQLFDDGSESSCVVSAKSYTKYQRNNGSVEIIVYDSAIQTGGVTYNISQDERHYQSCYIENIAGKTVDTIRSYGTAVLTVEDVEHA
jgi:hypothetical protein